FDYLASLDDLIVFMDEAHRYYASAGAKAINDLSPVLGIELTATPKTTGARPRDFTNIVYHYPLAQALQDGYVKVPAVATRRDFDPSRYASEELEKIKLEDGIHHHEYVKAELESYARNHNARRVKPFMLVVAQDTRHAGELKQLVETVFEGRYKDKVIEVHSNQGAEESDDAMKRLLAVETDDHTEVVIHVNKLKEGWDVTNLYTIVPLRASASEILTEQTIGRGLRLPYGTRTGVEAVDRLTIVAHDRFQAIIDQANDAESIIKKTVYIGDDGEDGIPMNRPAVFTAPPVGELESIGSPITRNDAPFDDGVRQTPALDENRRRIATIALRVAQDEAPRLNTARDYVATETRAKITARVERDARALMPQQGSLEGMEAADFISDEDIANIVDSVTSRLAETTIDIPQITILPTREVNYGFNDFDLEDLARQKLQPVDQEILVRHLDDNRTHVIQRGERMGSEARPEDYIVRSLMDIDAIDYDEHAAFLYKLASQYVAHLKTYLDDSGVENVLIHWQQTIRDFIFAQMKAHMWTTPTDYTGKVTQGFQVLKPATFTGIEVVDFRQTPAAGKRVHDLVFSGFRKCCFPLQKFDSVEGELRLAQVLEDDGDVLRWMKPAPGQFRIEYQDSRQYEPDFVVEIAEQYLMIEPKRASQIDAEDTQQKRKAAERWCQFANQAAADTGAKPWQYVLVPHDEIVVGRSVKFLTDRFGSR
ncbi:MAG: hypothetical protein KDI19_16075, partial [Pseudomonadales bacterium]|nr:hypothetical protein [Pseudomonadales bacterium]